MNASITGIQSVIPLCGVLQHQSIMRMAPLSAELTSEA